MPLVRTRADQLSARSQFLALAQSRLLASSSSYHLKPLFFGLVALSFASLISLGRLGRIWSVETGRARQAVVGVLFAFLGSLFATSFIEEEHEIWYFVSVTALIVSILRCVPAL